MDGWMKSVKNDEVIARNRNLNRGFRKLEVWREAIELYVFVKEALGGIKGLSFKIRDQILTLLNLAKSLSKKLKTGQDWNSDYKT
jgi:hypothetical protein